MRPNPPAPDLPYDVQGLILENLAYEAVIEDLKLMNGDGFFAGYLSHAGTGHASADLSCSNVLHCVRGSISMSW